MKVSGGFIITQAVAKQFEGLKGDGIEGHNFFRIYKTKEDAYDFLSTVVNNIKLEIRVGYRAQNNLNPEEGLDFCVTECTVDIPNDKMLERGWKFANIPD